MKKQPPCYKNLQALEEGLSEVRKTKTPRTFDNLQTLEEVSLIKQAKREHHPVTATFSAKAFINLDDETLFHALETGIIDALVIDTDLIYPFLEEAVHHFSLSEERLKLLLQSN